jgi:hypothetical protein
MGVRQPVTSTSDATNIGPTSFTGNGSIDTTNPTPSDATERGFVYMEGTSGDPLLENDDPSVSETGTWAAGSGAFSLEVTNLSSSTNYRVRAYALNSAGTGYGTTITVTTTAVSAPSVTTNTTTSITNNSATANGDLTNTGGANVTERGFCYISGTSGDPTTSNDKVSDTPGPYSTGTYSKSITGLSAGTNYRIRAYALNSAGTGYGTTLQIKTFNNNTVMNIISNA